MANAMDADKAIAALNGTLLDERALIVNEARPKKEPGSFRDRCQGYTRADPNTNCDLGTLRQACSNISHHSLFQSPCCIIWARDTTASICLRAYEPGRPI
jgi:hypothetical protein